MLKNTGRGEKMIGELLGNRYEIIEKIGGGGMALVYKAKCRLLNRFVAVKILRSELIEDEEFVGRFNVEAQAAASLSHPNIVSVYDVGQQHGIYYIVMEYINGSTLKEIITGNGPLFWKDALNVAMQICSALEHAHKNRVIHRDIKPHNIMITEDKRAKVTDFGIARAVSSSTVNLGGNTIGSVHYFSPEQARGGYTDERSDIYSLGIVMYEMITGKVPFDGESPVAIAMKHIQELPIPPGDINTDVPGVIQSIILKAISKEQGNRYASAAEMLGDINKAFKTPDEDFVETENIDDSPTQKIPIINNIDDGSEIMVKKRAGRKKKVKKEDRIAVIAAIITSFIIIGGISYASYHVYKDYAAKRAPKEAPVPNLLGKDLESVKTAYSEQGFNIVEFKQVYDDEHEKGQIVSQEPGADKMVVIPSDIEVTVSMGAEMVKVPLLKNWEYREAEIELEAKGLKPDVRYDSHDRVPEGCVIRHVPESQVEVKKGEFVQLYVSTGPEITMVTMQDLTGKTAEEAKQIIQQLGLVPGEVESRSSDRPKNEVIEQSVAEGQEVEEKTKVDLVVSEGKADESRTQTISIHLPQDKEQVKVKIVADDGSGKKVVYEKVHQKEESPLEIEMSGKGNVPVQLYFDDSDTPVYEDTLEFGGVE